MSPAFSAVIWALASPINIDGHPLTVFASVGLMEEQVANTCTVDLMKCADAALRCEELFSVGIEHRRHFSDAVDFE